MTTIAAHEPEIQAPSGLRGPFLFGMAVILIFFGGFGTWGALAPLASAVVASGTLVVEGQRKTVQHLEGGIVERILVKEGDKVEAGQLLLQVESTAARSLVDVLRSQLAGLLVQEARLTAEREGRERFVLPPELDALRLTPAVMGAMASETSYITARTASYRGQVELVEKRISQLDEQIMGFRALRESQSEQSRLIKDELSGLRQLLEQGYVSRSRVLALERNAAQLDGQAAQYASDIARARQQITESQTQIAQLKRQREDEVSRDLRDVQQKISELRPRMQSAVDVLERTEIRAPIGGLVVGLTVFTQGGVIDRGRRLMDIVPADSVLVVEAAVRPEDVNEVRIGGRAEIRFSALTQRNLPVVDGQIRALSADRLVEERSGRAYYTAMVTVDPTSLARLGTLVPQPGMPVEVMFPTGNRSALDYLLSPLARRFDKALLEP